MNALSTYRRKRDFATSPEPRGSLKRKKGALFVVQKHAATQLHYDFRLELDGVLKSWAVPKGPSLDPGVKRLAMHVEDHPLEYGSFEGTIPEGYGAGTVMLWDRGTWENEADPSDGYRKGKLHFTLHGEKLRGQWVLVRRGKSESNDKEAWLLFKVRDQYARPDGPDVLQEEPLSVASGRDLEQIASARQTDKTTWKTNRKSARRASDPAAPDRNQARGKSARKSLRHELANLVAAKEAPLPRKIQPQLATLVKEPPRGTQWLSEIKFDGYRMLARVERRNVHFLSRNQLDWTERLEGLVKAVRGLGLESAVFDGEVVVQQLDGTTSFQALQNAFREGNREQLIYYVFDLLYLNGKNLTKLPLEMRKQLLSQLVAGQTGPLRYSEHMEGDADLFFRQACQHHLEGIICKRRDRPYRAGRSADWLKVKCAHREEFIIGGYTPPAGSRRGFGALLVGYYDQNKKFKYAGRVGTGYSDRLLDELSQRLKEIEQHQSPFADLQGRTGVARGVHWVKPKLVAQVEFGQWTRDGLLRHPSFQGLREDKSPSQVTRERPLNLEQVAPEMNNSPTKAGARGSSPRTGGASMTHTSSKKRDIAELPTDVRLTHPEKLLFPDAGITKADLAQYYARVADWILPHLVDRPLVLVRCPEGLQGECFFQKHARVGTPESLRRVTISEKDKTIDYVVVDDLQGLLSLVQISALEIHAWGARTDQIEQPDRLVFDLDPDPSVSWARVVDCAQQLRAFFEDLGLVTFVKTSGGKGLHIVLPLTRRLDWDDAKRACQQIAAAIVRADPSRYTANMSKAARTHKIYIDYQRNSRGATVVAAYSTRAREGAPVSMPVAWQDLPRLTSAAQFTLANATQHLARLKHDPWKGIAGTRQYLSKRLLSQLSG